MPAFGSRRKARVINVDHNDGSEEPGTSLSGGSSATVTDPPSRSAAASPDPPVRFASKSSRKPFRQSGLRQSLNLNADPDGDGGADAPPSDASAGNRNGGGDDDDDGPVVVRPSVSRSGSHRKKRNSARLFSGGAGDEEPEQSAGFAAPKKVPLSQRVLENSAIKKGLAVRGLPTRHGADDDHEGGNNGGGRGSGHHARFHEREYSKAYLDELQSSTPNTPQNLSSVPFDQDESMVFDSSELDGALIMDESELGLASKSQSPPPPEPRTTTILTDAQVRERKERRARMANEADYISFDDDDHGDSMHRKSKPKKESRLVAEDEELGEGFDSFVEDGGITLGKSATRAAKRKQQREIADMILQAEDDSDESSDESEAERRAAYEAAQARAGMDGLGRERKAASQASSNPAATSSSAATAAAQVPSRITPLPDLASCLSRLKERLDSVKLSLQAGSGRVASLQRERAEIVAREVEVQRKLDEAGERYRAAAAGAAAGAAGGGLIGQGSGSGAAGVGALSHSVVGTSAHAFQGHRGLESLGTPGGRDSDGDVDGMG